MRKLIIAQSEREFYTSNSGLALVGICLNELSLLPSKAKEAFPSSPGTSGVGMDDIVRSSVGLLTLGHSDYEAVANHKEND